MKKFTLIAMAFAALSTTANAELMDKYFFKIPTDKFADGWVVQDAGNFVSTPGKDYLQVQNKKNGGRMLNYFWNEDAWQKVDVAKLPNATYKFTMDLNMASMAARSDMEFVLLPINACTSTDSRVSTHNYRWVSGEGEDYFFRWRVGPVPKAANGDFTIYINEVPTAKNDWSKTTEDSLVLKSQVTYKFAVEINGDANTATYTISDAEGNSLKTGVHNYVCAEDRAGIMAFSMNGGSIHQISNLGLSYLAEGPFANEPTVDLLAARGAERDYYVNFHENEILHWIQLGNAEDAFGTQYEDGQEYTIGYWEANDTRDFEQDAENYFGSKIIFASKSGQLKTWTTMETDEENKSEEVLTDVDATEVVMPTPEAKITNVEAGYGKEYTIIADNSETLLKPTVTVKVTVKDASGSIVSTKEALSGEKVKLEAPGSLELYAYDGTHPSPWYGQSETVTVNNNAEYEVAENVDYALDKATVEAGKVGFTKEEIVEASNKSRWDRIYSTQKYGYDAAGNSENWVDGTDYTFVKEGFGFYDLGAIGTENAKWPVLTPDDPTTAFAPLSPTDVFLANSKYNAAAWHIFPLEGIVYYDTQVNNAELQLDAKYTSDDAAKPNFYIIHKRGGYDRPDKGDCNSTEVVEAGKTFNLYRYDTAINDVKVLTYKGFVPGTTGIVSVKNDTKANADAPIYNLAGQKVGKDYKGIVIQNGKKFVK
jgi:hypothetical protein